MSDAAPRSEPRMTRSRAKALGGTTPVKSSIFSELASDIKRGATALLGGKSKTKKDASSDVATNLFDKVAPQVHEEPTQDFAARDQDQSVATTPPVAPSLEGVTVPALLPASPAPAQLSPVQAPAQLATLQPCFSPAPPVMAASFDDMAISPAIMPAPEAPSPPPAVRPFGTPVEMDLMAASPMQLNSPAMMPHMSPLMEDRHMPQEPVAEESVYELPRGEEAVAEPSVLPASPSSPAAGKPASPSSLAAEPATATQELVATTPRPVATTPVRQSATLKTPRSAGVQGATARTAPKVPLTAVKPPSGISRTPSAQRVPLTAAEPTAAKAAVKLEPSTQMTPAAKALGPSVVKPASSVAAKPVGQHTVKRVSIATPVAASTGPASTRPIVRTPYPRSGSKTPVAFAADDMEADEEEVAAAATPEPAAAPVEAASIRAATPAAETAVVPTPAEPVQEVAALQELAVEADAPTRLVNATMQLAAALPPSYRTTCEEAPAVEPAAPNIALTPTPSVHHGFEDGGMDVDEQPPAAAVDGFSLAACGVPQDEGTPELKPLGRVASAGATAVAQSTPMSTKAHSVARLANRATPGASTTPKLTIPVSAEFGFMASTKSFEQKARPLQPNAAPAVDAKLPATAALKPRIKSEAVGVRGDDKSMKQLKREIKAAMDAKLKLDVKGLDSDDEMGEAPYSAANEAMLVDAMSSKVQISAPRVVLKGLPAAQGTHIRFNDNGKAVASPSNGRVQLRGVPAATGSHKRFT